MNSMKAVVNVTIPFGFVCDCMQVILTAIAYRHKDCDITQLFSLGMMFM